MIYFSPSTLGFYRSDLHGSNIPSDKVEITEQRWLELRNGQAQGRAISVGQGGAPVLGAAPVFSDVPDVVSATQAKIALAGAGLFDSIDTFMSGLPKADPRRIAWETAAEFTRDSPTLSAVAQQLSLSSAQVDALFKAADAITV